MYYYERETGVRLTQTPGTPEFLAEIQRSNDVEWIVRRADEKLTDTLRWAADTVPAYRSAKSLLRRDRSPSELLTEFPLLPKENIKPLYEYLLRQNYISEALTLSVHDQDIILSLLMAMMDLFSLPG